MHVSASWGPGLSSFLIGVAGVDSCLKSATLSKLLYYYSTKPGDSTIAFTSGPLI